MLSQFFSPDSNLNYRLLTIFYALGVLCTFVLFVLDKVMGLWSGVWIVVSGFSVLPCGFVACIRHVLSFGVAAFTVYTLPCMVRNRDAAASC